MFQIKTIIQKINLDKIKKIDKNKTFLAVAVLVVIVTAVLVILNIGPSPKSTAQKSVDYINKNLLQGQEDQATLEGISQESGLIKFQIKIGAQSYDGYATKDGKLFLPKAFDLNTSPSENIINQ